MLFLLVCRNHFFLRFSASFASLGPGISTNPSLLATKNTIGGDPSSQSLQFRRAVARFFLYLFETLPVTYVLNSQDYG